MRPIKRAIILCWIMLVACFAIKLFGGNWFEVVCTNEHFSNLCDFVQNNKVAFEIFSFVLYVFPSYITVMSISLIPRPSKKQVIIMTIGILSVWLSRFISIQVKSALEVVNAICMPIILNYYSKERTKLKIILKKYWFYGFVGYGIILVFQIISLITRNIGIKIISDNVLVTFIMLIDYYIMLLLYFLYIKLKKEKNYG